MELKRVMWVRRYQGQCRALQPLGHQGYRLRSYKKDQPLCSGYIVHPGDQGPFLPHALEKLKKVPTRTGPRCAPSASNPC